MQGHVLAILLQSFAMLQQDEFVYTKPNIGPHFHVADSAHPQWPAGYFIVYEEANPFQKPFTDNDLWVPSYILNVGGTAVVTGLLDDFDHQHLKGSPIGTADIFLGLIVYTEIQAIHSWARFGLGPPEVKWTFFTHEF